MQSGKKRQHHLHFLCLPNLPTALTPDEILLGFAVDAGQMAAVLSAVLFGVLPGVSAAEIPVAVAVKLPPRVLTTLCVCKDHETQERRLLNETFTSFFIQVGGQALVVCIPWQSQEDLDQRREKFPEAG